MNEKNVVKRPQYSEEDKAWFVEHKGFDGDYPGFHRSWAKTEEAAQHHFDNLVGRGYEVIAADVVIASGYAAQYAPKGTAQKAETTEQPAAKTQPEVAAQKSLEEISASAAANTEKAADEAYASGEPVEIEARREPNEIYSAASLDYLEDGLYVYSNGSGLKTMFIVVGGNVHGRRFEVRADVAGKLYTAYHMAVTGSPYSDKLVARRFGTTAQYDALLAQIVASSDAMHDMMLNS